MPRVAVIGKASRGSALYALRPNHHVGYELAKGGS